jgi:hypothetical protein
MGCDDSTVQTVIINTGECGDIDDNVMYLDDGSNGISTLNDKNRNAGGDSSGDSVNSTSATCISGNFNRFLQTVAIIVVVILIFISYQNVLA